MYEYDFPEVQMTATVLQCQRTHKLFTFPTNRECLLFDFLKCTNTIFRGFQIIATVLQHQRMHKLFTFPANREGLRFLIFSNARIRFFEDFKWLQRSYHIWECTICSLSPLTGISCNIYNGVSGISNNYNGFTTLENAQVVHFPRARGKYRL